MYRNLVTRALRKRKEGNGGVMLLDGSCGLVGGVLRGCRGGLSYVLKGCSISIRIKAGPRMRVGMGMGMEMGMGRGIGYLSTVNLASL